MQEEMCFHQNIRLVFIELGLYAHSQRECNDMAMNDFKNTQINATKLQAISKKREKNKFKTKNLWAKNIHFSFKPDRLIRVKNVMQFNSLTFSSRKKSALSEQQQQWMKNAYMGHCRRKIYWR